MARMEWRVKSMIALSGFCLLFFTAAYIFESDAAEAPMAIEDFSYGVIIDAGSTGSRLFLYRWRSLSDRELIKIEPALDRDSQPIVRKVSPGLSTFGEKPEAAPAYIQPLLDYAYQYIPYEKRSSTSLFIFATAGMRLLPTTQQEAVMQSLRSALPRQTDLLIRPDNIKVIDGTWEGIYNWIAVNYIIGRFDRLPSTDGATLGPRKPTVGMIDMGGASTQIAFELTSSEFSSESVQVVNLGARETDNDYRYKLFVTTFLGYGVNEGARKYEGYLGRKFTETNSSSEVAYVRDGCLPVNLMRLVTNEDGTQYVRKGTGEWDKCVENVINILTKEGPKCPDAQQCYFGGVVAPPIQLSDLELYGFSEYWYSVEDVLSLGGTYNHSTFEERARGFCSQRWPLIKSKARAQLYPKANEERLETQCFKSAWIHAILHNGFFVSEERHKFKSANTMADQEVQWALGAMIYHMRHYPVWHLSAGSSGSHGMLKTLGFVVLLCIAVALGVALWVAWKGRPGVRRDRAGWNYHRVPENFEAYDPKYQRGSRSYVSLF